LNEEGFNMALDFDLEIKSRMTPSEIVELILKLDGFHRTTDIIGFYAEGVVCSVNKIASEGYYPKVHQEIMLENFGFVPTLRLSYRPDGYEGYEAGMRNGLKAFMTVLQNDDGDAVCILNGESIKFTRIGGKLVLNSDSFSNDKELVWSFDQIPVSFETKKFEILD